MPTMHEIYRRHADRYDELVRAEDHENNLGRKLHELVDWKGASVLEAGTGTGRVTRLYIETVAGAVCCDASAHMLAYAEKALSRFADKITFQVARNENLPQLERQVDVFVEGWSFGHRVMECAYESQVPAAAAELLRQAGGNLKPGGPVVLIETLGTNVREPHTSRWQLARFYDELVSRHGFVSHVIPTDYRFSSNREAARVLGFFFGDEMKVAVERSGQSVIPEWTGVWIGRPRGSPPAEVASS